MPRPRVTTEPEARLVFDRIVRSDLEFAYQLPFWGTTSGEAVKPFSPTHRPEMPDRYA
jgi:hypothetical protein